MNAAPSAHTRSAALATRDRAVLWHPCTQMKDHEDLPPLQAPLGELDWEAHSQRQFEVTERLLRENAADVAAVIFMPPYVVTERDIDLMVQTAAEGIEIATCD